VDSLLSCKTGNDSSCPARASCEPSLLTPFAIWLRKPFRTKKVLP
jgi:hypothetical protein